MNLVLSSGTTTPFAILAVAGVDGIQGYFALALLAFLSTRLFRVTGRMQNYAGHAVRLVLGVAVAVGLVVSVREYLSDDYDLSECVWSGLSAALLAALVGGLVSPPALFIVLYVVLPPFQAVKRWQNDLTLAENARRSEAESRWQRELAAREALRKQAEEEACRKEELLQEEIQRIAQRRRQDARARCEVVFSLQAPEISDRFTRKMFDDYVRRYMGDKVDPDEVNERASQLEALLLDHVERAQPPPKFRSLEDIARWFEEQRKHLEKLPDDRVRQTLVAKLKARYTELTTEFLEEMQA